MPSSELLAPCNLCAGRLSASIRRQELRDHGDRSAWLCFVRVASSPSCAPEFSGLLCPGASEPCWGPLYHPTLTGEGGGRWLCHEDVLIIGGHGGGLAVSRPCCQMPR